MGANRAQRRALKRNARRAGLKSGQKFIKAGAAMDEALEALKGLEGIDGANKALMEARRQVNEAHLMVTALVDDYQTLADELELHRKIMTAIIAGSNTMIPDDLYEALTRERE